MTKANEHKTNPKPDAIPAEKKLKSESIGVRLEEDLRKDVDRICTEDGIPTAVLIRDAVKDYIKNPARHRTDALRSMAITRQHIERARAAGTMPAETADELLEKLEAIEHSLKGEKLPPKRRPASAGEEESLGFPYIRRRRVRGDE